ncbi:hypothetical protein DRP05_14475 [Archaeoglobales archaeon]|nr:MAG: hypothetical protein DRP05_14475 [Archaeoglobales archaeon]
MKLAIATNEKGSIVFKIVILHNLLVNLILVSTPSLGLFNKNWDLGWISELFYGYPIFWIFCSIINFLMAFGVWRWMKSG